MIDFIEYVVSEIKNKRLSKGNALSLIKQFSQNSSKNSTTATIHPLLHTNTSDLHQQSYSTVLNGNEHFLADHQVKLGENTASSILPGVAYLEMACAATANALPKVTEAGMLELENIVWLKPFFVSESKQINIALTAAEDEKILFEIYSQENDATDNYQETIHCEGVVNYFDKETVSPLDIAQLKGKMNRGELTSNSIYSAYNAMGLLYGPAHQVISAIYQGENQLIAKLNLPENLISEKNNYLLHPSLMDGALQSSLGLLTDLNDIPDSPRMPFALENIRVISACTENMYAWVRYSAGSSPEDKITKLDLDICDQEGNVCVQMLGFTSKTVVAEKRKLENKAIAIDTLLAELVWEPVEQDKISLGKQSELDQHHLVLCDLPEIDIKQIERGLPGIECSILKVSSEKNIAERYNEVALYCFKKIQSIIKGKPKGKVHIQFVTNHNPENEVLAGISGMLRTAMLENPLISAQIIFTDQKESSQELITQLQINTHDSLVKYADGKRFVKKLKEIDKILEEPNISFKEQGVYVITGGLGGLGILFAEEILQKTKASKVILTGRADLSSDKEAKLKDFVNSKGRLEYRKLDLLNLKQVKEFISDVIKEHKRLNGIIHSAGMILDNYILKKTDQEFNQVLEPKVMGVYNLDQASADIDLDFTALFSSGVAVLGNPGQSDYAAANGFLDQYAIYKNSIQESTKNHGKVYAINWPLWQDGGMALDEAIMNKMKEETGIYPLKASTGILAFYNSVWLGNSQTLVVEGDLDKVRKLLFNPKEIKSEIIKPAPVKAIKSEPALNGGAPDNLHEKTREYLRKQFSSALKIPVHKIETSAALEKYGIDSVVAMNLTGQLEKTFGTLSKTLFFEYQTIDELSDYISSNFQEKLSEVLSITNPVAKLQNPVITEAKKEVRPQTRNKSRRRYYQQSNNQKSDRAQSFNEINNDPIAIVGLSGRYPASENIEEYWNNLRDGKDCITEVPKERWDWRDYYNEDKTDTNTHSSKWGGFIKGVDEFDPRFFNISPREASYIDPQERLFLQHSWMAIEDAGLTRASLQIPYEDDQNGQVGVYVGVMYGEYNLSGSLASIANRVSYFLNLHGPSMTLDTMCSSSLTAIHLACQDLKLGRTNLAIAGGVNVSIDANKYRMLSSGQFISSDGHCQSFGEGGDGYIPGEGVGAVVLKRLSEAEKDKNHIYGIIRGSALNHGGKTNGYTVPNPLAQAGAISRALRESGTDPKHISFVEAHGTGTKLGDPIEIAALTKAFQLTGEENHCLIGSSKSNIGHCESAAGIAGLTKVLLQMKHQQIVPSLHSEQLNPNIDFKKTPFVVNQTLRNWERPSIKGKSVSRMAGLSSFGAGGSNAHIILEEYTAKTKENYETDFEVIIPLSARTPQQLQQKALELQEFIERTQLSEQSTHEKLALFKIAYTLQVGREAMDERLALIVTSIGQLSEKLKAYVNGASDIEDIYRGQVRENKETISLFNTDTDFQETIEKWILQKKYAKITDLWAKGLDLNWSKFYGQEKIQLVSLPTYPFAKEKYWNEPELRGKIEIKDQMAAVLHPLLHTNTSNLERQSYSTTFSGREFFIKDYELKLNETTTEKALPAMAGLEMARAAIEAAKPSSKESDFFELQQIAWGNPFMLNGDNKIEIALFKEDEGQIDFEIFSKKNGAEVIHSQGLAVFQNTQKSFKVDFEGIKNQIKGEKLQAKEIYESFYSKGMQYGTASQVIVSAFLNDRQILATLCLPQTIENSETNFVLHPSILESVVQASNCLANNLQLNTANLFIPVSADLVSIYKACNKEMYAWVRYAQDANSVSDTICIDADLCDVNGNVCSQIRGLALQPIALRDAAHTNSEVSLKAFTVEFPELKLEKPQAVQLSSFNDLNAITESAVLYKPKGIHLIDSKTISDSAVKIKNDEIKKISLDSLNKHDTFSYDIDDVIKEAESGTPNIVLDTKNQDNYKHQETSEPLTLVSKPVSSYTKEQLKQLLTDTLAEALYLEPFEIDSDKSFIDLGLDSIVGVEWIKTINKKLEMELSSTKIYDYATVNALAQFLQGELKKEQIASSNHSATKTADNSNSKSESVKHSVNEYS